MKTMHIFPFQGLARTLHRMTLDTPVTRLPTVHGKVAEGLEHLGIRNVRHLLFHFPSRYEDRRNVTPIAQVTAGVPVVVHGTIKEMTSDVGFRRRGGRARRMQVTRAVVEDETGRIAATWFYQRYLDRQIPVGTSVALAGTVSLSEEGLTLMAPEVERLLPGKTLVHTGRLVPVYPETAGVTSRNLRFLVSRTLPLTDALTEYLPEQTREQEQLEGIAAAARGIHFPENPADLERAQERLGFDELFLLQLAAAVRRRARNKETAVPLAFSDDVVADVGPQFPFHLTSSQERAVKSILQDLRMPVPMNRLVAGDVGSGKTVVAGLAALAVARSGGQTAFVAPTEILATQHAVSLKSFFAVHGLSVGLLTGSTPSEERVQILEQVRTGSCTCLVGTHALFHEDIRFQNLALVVVDEQHRFGVDQRAELSARGGNGKSPHFLSLTATPIPRTLQLTAYGDVDVTMLDPRPGQQTVETHVVSPDERDRTYQALAERIKTGEQVFVICPRVEERDDDVRSVTSEYRRLHKEVFPAFRVGMLHGKLPPEEKRDTLERFRNRDLDLLVSSSVVEVGVDIPNATALLVEGAERFGLAQLHQFRGRVGRRGQQAVCFLASGAGDEQALERLRVLEHSSNGLEIAEADLRRRGAGEIYGTRQSGGVRLRIARLTDLSFLERVRHAAIALLDEDPMLKTAPLLARRIAQLNVTTHFE